MQKNKYETPYSGIMFTKNKQAIGFCSDRNKRDFYFSVDIAYYSETTTAIFMAPP